MLQGSGLQSSRRRERPFNGVREAEVRYSSGPEKERLETRTGTLLLESIVARRKSSN